MGRFIAHLHRLSMKAIEKQTQRCWPRHHAASDATVVLDQMCSNPRLRQFKLIDLVMLNLLLFSVRLPAVYFVETI